MSLPRFIRCNLCNSNFFIFSGFKKKTLEKGKTNLKSKEFVQKYCFTTDGLGVKFCIVYGTYILRISYEQ